MSVRQREDGVIVLEGSCPVEDAEPLLQKIRTSFLPNKVVARADGRAKLPLLEGKGPVQGKAAAYVCENMACKAPVTDPTALEEALRR